MIIRSQDKTMLMPFENSNGAYIVGKEVHICGDNYGEYSTREKAIKVLDMIQNAYTNSCKVAISSDGQMQYMVIPVVFQMPLDSEV